MKTCKYCQAELAENGTFCPSCGKDNSEVVEETAAPGLAEQEAVTEEVAAPAAAEEESTEKKKATPGKIALAVVAVVVLVAILVALIAGGANKPAEDGTVATEPAGTVEETAAPATIPADGNPDDETCKGSYTVTDEEILALKDTVVANIGDHTLTNGQLQIYYWLEVQTFLSNYGYYASYFGLDYTQPLDTQLHPESNMTWQQYFLQCALKNWHLTQALAIAAEESGMEVSQEDRKILDEMPAQLEAMAASYGITLEELLYNNFGAGAGLPEYTQFQELYVKGAPYYTAETGKFVPTDAELEAYFAEHEAQYAEGGVSKEDLYVNVRHILIGLEGGTVGEDGVTTFSEEEWAACEKEAQTVLDEWLAGDKTEDSFAALANEKSEDGGSNTNGGLYENVYKGQMVAPFEEWCFDASRQTGDYGLVKTDFGYHIMYFVKSHPQWKYFTESDWVTEQTNNMTSALMDGHPMEVAYEDIALGYINMEG